MRTTQRGTVGFGPSHLQVNRRTSRVESRYRATADGFLLKNRNVIINDETGAGSAAARCVPPSSWSQSEGCERRRRAGDRQILRRACVQRDGAGSGVEGWSNAGDRVDLREQSTDRVGDIDRIAYRAGVDECERRAVNHDGIAGCETRYSWSASCLGTPLTASLRL